MRCACRQFTEIQLLYYILQYKSIYVLSTFLKNTIRNQLHFEKGNSKTEKYFVENI